MTKIVESSACVLNIVYTRSLINKIIYGTAAAAMLAPAVMFLIWDPKPEPDAQYPEFAPIFLLLLEIFLLSGSAFFLSSVFDATDYLFDRTADKFYLKGRRNFFRKWTIEGAVSDITGVSCEIYGQDENTDSEIFLKYRIYASVAETVKCGTGEEIEDGIITDYIKNFIEEEKIKS